MQFAHAASYCTIRWYPISGSVKTTDHGADRKLHQVDPGLLHAIDLDTVTEEQLQYIEAQLRLGHEKYYHREYAEAIGIYLALVVYIESLDNPEVPAVIGPTIGKMPPAGVAKVVAERLKTGVRLIKRLDPQPRPGGPVGPDPDPISPWDEYARLGIHLDSGLGVDLETQIAGAEAWAQAGLWQQAAEAYEGALKQVAPMADTAMK